MTPAAAIKNLHIAIAEKRGTSATYCPSEVARLYAPDDWRKYMDMVREVADQLIASELLVVMQNGETVVGNATDMKGPIRLRLRD